jgi:hypothetical protein
MIRISFNLNGNNIDRASYYVFAIFTLVLMHAQFMFILGSSQKSVYLFRMSNESNVRSNLYCGIPYDDCRCFLVSTEDCLSNKHVKTARILPLASFVLQIFFIREFFSLSGCLKSFFVYLLWITCMFAFISILVIVYRKPCYYDDIASVLCCTGSQLFFVVCYTVMSHRSYPIDS